ncbi:hypothetical protein Taro_041020 [Colocasia esculenta]|uniref:Transmembrane protein n=1 Tax=Colocasia esculenta TaxID=4460 RepID=A0A843WKG3_COLES|nr:hypothetical protein [Colocasia esculenta]
MPRSCFHIAFDPAGSVGVVFGPTLVVGRGITLFPLLCSTLHCHCFAFEVEVHLLAALCFGDVSPELFVVVLLVAVALSSRLRCIIWLPCVLVMFSQIGWLLSL